MNWPLHFYWKRNPDSILLKFSFLNGFFLINDFSFLPNQTQDMQGQIYKLD